VRWLFDRVGREVFGEYMPEMSLRCPACDEQAAWPEDLPWPICDNGCAPATIIAATILKAQGWVKTPEGREALTRRFGTRPADLSKMKPLEFVYYPWLVRGRLNDIVGEEKAGKTSLCCWMAAELTRGKLPGKFDGQPTRVLFIGADEDAWNDTTMPRLYAAGADFDYIEEFYALDEEAIFDAERDSSELGRLLAKGFGLVVIEHLMDVLPAMRNPSDPVAIRRVTKPLRRALSNADTAALATLHDNKADATTFRQKAQGSVQFGAMARSSFVVAKHPKEDGRRVAVLAQANYVPDDEDVSLSFKIENYEFDYDGEHFKVGRVVDLKQGDGTTVEDVLARPESKRGRETRERRSAVLAALTDEPQSVRAIAKAAGGSKSSVQRDLEQLEIEGRAEQREAGWLRCPTVPEPKESDTGTAL
jgi:hypothetical protein